ncbi:PilZ domain-containing protein [Sphingobium aromaticiconvertens]|uniref:PilZ domain-containing protein n=1 Tax=Sphingobium aromaticiconvertens TaxID=365341 RepID=UPI00301745BF
MNQHRAIRPKAQDFQRASPRYKLFEPVSMRVDGLPVRGHLLDLSRSGALAHADAGVLPGARVELEGVGILTSSRVMWVEGRRFGLRFDTWLSNTLVTMIVGGITSPGATFETG